MSSFVLNDGGLFYQMILDLLNNHYALPTFTAYNHASLPFAYPPLAFYLYAGLHQVSNIPLLTLMQILPAIVSTLTVPAFYLLASDLLNDKTQAALASLAFALLPRTFDWLIMGGGTTRSLGLLFALLAIRQIYLLFTKPNRRAILFTILLSTLVVCTHPEATVHVIIAAAVIYIWKDRSAQSTYRAAIVASGTLLISSPWWGMILIRHGLSPFNAALTASGQDSVSFLIRIVALIKFDFTNEPYLQLLAVIGLIGLFILISQRNYAFPVWLVLMGLIEPRGGALYMMVPLSLSAGVALDQVIPSTEEKVRSWARVALGGFCLLYGTINATSITTKIREQITLTEDDRSAFAWVEANTPSDAKFLLVTQRLPLNDAISEWFPALTGRISLATVFGYEWVNGGLFTQRIAVYEDLQACANQGLTCLEAWGKENDSSWSYIYLCLPTQAGGQHPSLAEQLEASSEYQLLYETETVEIFSKANDLLQE